MAISKHTLSFLSDLAKHNNKEWFTTHKSSYTNAHQDMITFADQVLNQMRQYDKIQTPTGKKSIKRIYRDVRFSSNKSPYKNNFGIGFERSGIDRRGGFFIHIQPGHTFIGGGFWSPEKEDLLRIRKHISADDTELRKVITSQAFTSTFGNLEGGKLKVAPKGFDKADPAIDLLRYKQYIIHTSFTDSEVLSDDFVGLTVETLTAMLPFFSVMTEMLTTDLNGESI